MTLRREGLGLQESLGRLRARVPYAVRTKAEVESLEEVAETLAAGAGVILPDNVSPAMMAQPVRPPAGWALA